MRPMELMALSVASCSSYDVVTILKKARQEISSCEADVEAVRVDSVPSVFESIHLHFRVSGTDLNARQLQEHQIIENENLQIRIVLRKLLREKVKQRMRNPDENIDKLWNQVRQQINKELNNTNITLSSNAMGILKLWYRYGHNPIKLHSDLKKRRKNKSFANGFNWDRVEIAFSKLLESHNLVNAIYSTLSSNSSPSSNNVTNLQSNELTQEDEMEWSNNVYNTEEYVMIDLCLIPTRNCIFEDIYFEAGFTKTTEN